MDSGGGPSSLPLKKLPQMLDQRTAIRGGLFFSVRYATVRERGKATEDFNLKREGDVWKMHGYNVNSPDLF